MSNASAFWLRIDGVAATEISPNGHTPPTWETLADGGIGEISWALSLTPRSQHQALRAGVLVEVMCESMPVATGLLTEPDRSTWECHAFGLSSTLRQTAAFDADGNSTTDLLVALTTAIAEGTPVINPTPIAGTVAGDSSTGPIMVGTLLDQYAEQTGQRWGVDASRRVFMRPDPVSPTWLASPDSAAFGVADEDTPTRIIGRYNAGGGLFLTRKVGVLGRDQTVDITDRGPITPVAADAILAGMLQRRGETAWVNGVTLHREQLTTRGGTPAFLASVTAGQMLRAHGLASNVISQAPWLDVTIGKTRYTAGEDVIYLEPVNTAPRNFVDVTAAA